MLIAAKRLVSLTRSLPGSMIIGNQMGSLDAGQYEMPTGKGFNYRHNQASMERFWRQVGDRSGGWSRGCFCRRRLGRIGNIRGRKLIRICG